MEEFCIAVAKRLDLPGFGENAITDAQGNRYPLNRAEDYYLRMAANIAFMGKAPVAEASSEDLTLTGVQRILPVISQTLKAEEVSRVAFIYSAAGASRRTKAVERRIASVNCGKTAANLERGGCRPSPCHHRRALQRLPGMVSGQIVRRTRCRSAFPATAVAAEADLI